MLFYIIDLHANRFFGQAYRSHSCSLAPMVAQNGKQTFNKDPFCRIFLGQQVHETLVCSQGGRNPKWGDTLLFTNTGDIDIRI